MLYEGGLARSVLSQYSCYLSLRDIGVHIHKSVEVVAEHLLKVMNRYYALPCLLFLCIVLDKELCVYQLGQLHKAVLHGIEHLEIWEIREKPPVNLNLLRNDHSQLVLQLEVLEKLLLAAVEHHLAVQHSYYVIHYAGRPYQVVVHQYNRVSIKAYLLQHHLDQALAVGVQGAYRLVHYKNVGLHCQHRCYAHRLPLASRKISHAPGPQILQA